MAHFDPPVEGPAGSWTAAQPEPISRVLVAVGGRPRGDVALERAAQLRLAHGAAVTVLGEDPGDSAARRALEHRSQLRVVPTAQGPGFLDELRTEAETLDADLVVVGPERDSLRTRLFGSLAERLVLRGDIAVLHARNRPARPYRRVLVATDFSDISAAAVEFALRLVPAHGCEITVLHAYDRSYLLVLHQTNATPERRVSYALQARANAEAAMARFVSRWGEGPGVHPAVVAGEPSQEIRLAAQETGADLVVLGKHAKSPGHGLLGSVAAAALRKVRCDALVVPPGRSLH